MDKMVVKITEFNEVEVSMLKSRERLAKAIKLLNEAEYILRSEEGKVDVDQYYGFIHGDEELLVLETLKYCLKKLSMETLILSEISMTMRLKIPKLKLRPYIYDEEHGTVTLLSY